MTLRFHLPPGGDIPPASAARRLGLTLETFRAELPALLARGFPPADPTTGNFCLEAIDLWRTRARYPHLYGERIDASPSALDASSVVAERVARIARQ
jgi:hypothetical protein